MHGGNTRVKCHRIYLARWRSSGYNTANTSKGVTDVVRRVRSLWVTDFRADFWRLGGMGYLYMQWQYVKKYFRGHMFIFRLIWWVIDLYWDVCKACINMLWHFGRSHDAYGTNMVSREGHAHGCDIGRFYKDYDKIWAHCQITDQQFVRHMLYWYCYSIPNTTTCPSPSVHSLFVCVSSFSSQTYDYPSTIQSRPSVCRRFLKLDLLFKPAT